MLRVCHATRDVVRSSHLLLANPFAMLLHASFVLRNFKHGFSDNRHLAKTRATKIDHKALQYAFPNIQELELSTGLKLISGSRPWHVYRVR